MKARELETRLRNPGLLVLFTSDPDKGDTFEFGTHAELSEEADAIREQGGTCELTASEDLADRLDFEAYGDQEITVRI